MTTPTWRQRIGRALRALATRIDPQGKPGRKRKLELPAELVPLYIANSLPAPPWAELPGHPMDESLERKAPLFDGGNDAA